VSAFQGRVREFLSKALREAKQNSSWIAPHEEYERAVHEFVERILSDESQFLPDFLEFQGRVARAGALNGLSQLVVKIAAPGVPDFFQGSELWQLSLVDPDNRRPVDYKRRTAMLDALRRRETEDPVALIRDLAAHPEQDEMKMLVTYKALQLRKQNPALFAHGAYLPLRVTGTHAERVCAFARQFEDRWAVAVAPRWRMGIEEWGDTAIELPGGAPSEWKDAITGLIPASWRMADLLAEFPVGLLVG